MDVFFIYGLVDSDEPDVVRYVGQTHSLVKRFKQHHTGGYCGPVSMWRWAVGFFGRKIEMRLLEVVYGDRSDALARESWHIAQHESTGRLLNGLQYALAQKRAGVPDMITESYQTSLMALQSLIKLKGSRHDTAMYMVAKVVDRLETVHKTLMLCGQYDSFASHLHFFRNSIRGRVDTALVSR